MSSAPGSRGVELMKEVMLKTGYNPNIELLNQYWERGMCPVHQVPEELSWWKRLCWRPDTIRITRQVWNHLVCTKLQREGMTPMYGSPAFWGFKTWSFYKKNVTRNLLPSDFYPSMSTIPGFLRLLRPLMKNITICSIKLTSVSITINFRGYHRMSWTSQTTQSA